MCWTQKFSFSADPVILDLKLQLAAATNKLFVTDINNYYWEKINLNWDNSNLP